MISIYIFVYAFVLLFQVLSPVIFFLELREISLKEKIVFYTTFSDLFEYMENDYATRDKCLSCLSFWDNSTLGKKEISISKHYLIP